MPQPSKDSLLVSRIVFVSKDESIPASLAPSEGLVRTRNKATVDTMHISTILKLGRETVQIFSERRSLTTT